MIKKFFGIILLLISEFSWAEVKELTCSYGIKFWYSRDDSTPLINIAIAFKNSGAAHMDFPEKAVPNLFMSTISCGCGNYSKEEFQEKLQNISARLSGHADLDNVVFFYKYPKIVSDEAINLLELVLSSPKFEKKEVEKNKNAIVSLLENYQTSPIYWCTSVIIPQALFKNHPYGNSIGNAEYLLKLSHANLKSFHKKYIVRSNVELCIFGDVSETEAVTLADKILSAIPKGKKAQDNILDIQPILKNFIQNFHYEEPQSYIFFALPNILKTSEQKFAATLLYLILGGDSFKSKIIETLRSESGLIYSGGLQKIEHSHACFEIGILQTANKNVNTVIDKVKKLLKKLKDEGISEKELNFAKNNLKGKFLVNLRTSENLCYFYMLKKLQGHSLSVLEKFLKGIDSVTLDQVNSVAKKLLDEKNIPVVVIGGKE